MQPLGCGSGWIFCPASCLVGSASAKTCGRPADRTDRDYPPGLLSHAGCSHSWILCPTTHLPSCLLCLANACGRWKQKNVCQSSNTPLSASSQTCVNKHILQQEDYNNVFCISALQMMSEFQCIHQLATNPSIRTSIGSSTKYFTAFGAVYTNGTTGSLSYCHRGVLGALY